MTKEALIEQLARIDVKPNSLRVKFVDNAAILMCHIKAPTDNISTEIHQDIRGVCFPPKAAVSADNIVRADQKAWLN